jgi:membrane fusion protein (multidrug efflux system)
MRRMKISIQSILATILVIGFISCEEVQEKQAEMASSALAIDAYKVIPIAYNSVFSTTAELLPAEQVELMAATSGQVLNIYFKEGERVNKGARIIQLDDRDWQAQLVGIEAELDAAEADYERKMELLSIEGSSQEEIDMAFSKIQSLKSKQEQLLVNIDLANVKAPFSGQLGMRNFSKGAFLQQGAVITTLVDLDHLKVDFSLAQQHKKSLELGQTLSVLVGNDTLKAKIYAINPVIDMQSRTFDVRAILNQPAKNKIMPGSYAEVLISENFLKNALLVPTQAVVPSINDQTVYLYKNGKAQRNVIEMGDRTSDKVLVLSGIDAGDTVITSGLLLIKEGMDLEIQSLEQ